jgi:chorismate mutase
MMSADKDKSINWGGFRPGAGNKYKWRHGETKAVRIPIAIADKVLEVAKAIDFGEQVGNESVTQSCKDEEADYQHRLEKVQTINQEYVSLVAELRANLAKVTRQLQQVAEERDKYFEQIADIKLELDNLKDDSVTQSSQDEPVTQSRLNLSTIRDRILIKHPPAKRRELKKALDHFIGELAD